MKGNDILQMEVWQGAGRKDRNKGKIYSGNLSCQKLLLIKLRQEALPKEELK